MAVWPTGIATDANLFVAVNDLQTTLGNSITSTDTTIPVANVARFPASGAIAIDNEVIFYSGISGLNFIGLTRGADGTVAAQHAGGVSVNAAIVAAHHNVLKDEIEAIETSLVLLASKALVSDLNGHVAVSSVTTTELSYLSGVTSAIQTQLNSKESTITILPVAKGGTNSSAALTNNKVMISSAGAIVEGTVTTTSLSYLDATSSIQTQLNSKLPSASFTDSAVTSKILTGFVSGAGTVFATDTILQSIDKLDGNVGTKLNSSAFTDSAVTSKLITGFVSGAGTVFATDTILQSLNKIVGNDALKLPTASFTDAAVTSKLITGFISGAGTLFATDTILQAINKLDGNVSAIGPGLVHTTGTETINGSKTFGSPILAPNGTSSLPGYSFSSSPVTGFYIDGNGAVCLQNGLQRVFAPAAVSNQIIFNVNQLVTLNVAQPAANRIITLPDVGADANIVLDQGNQTINGTKTFSSALIAPVGAVGTPSYTFSGDTNTGFYHSASDQISVALGGTKIVTFDPAEVDFFSGQTNFLQVLQTAELTPRPTATWDLGDATYLWRDFYVQRYGIFKASGGAGQIRIFGSSGTDNWDIYGNSTDIRFYDNTGVGNVIFANTPVQQPAQPSFLVTNSAGQTDITGDGTNALVAWGNEIYDQGSNFASNTFTAPITGRYLFTMSVLLSGVLSSHTGAAYAEIVTSNREYIFNYAANGYLKAGSGNYAAFNGSVIADMDAGDTAVVKVTMTGGTKVVDVYNDAQFTTFSGSLIN